jgi:hypothetical protein
MATIVLEIYTLCQNESSLKQCMEGGMFNTAMQDDKDSYHVVL